MELFHVSYKPVENFSPRVPANRAEREDCEIPRICFAESIVGCINAKPSGICPILSGLTHHIPVALYVYSIQTEDYGSDVLMPPICVQEILHCPDALANCEYALLCKPKNIREQVFCVKDVVLRKNGYSVQNLVLEENPKDADAHILMQLTQFVNLRKGLHNILPEQILLQIPDKIAEVISTIRKDEKEYG